MVKKHAFDPDLRNLTPGERLWLARREAGLTQAVAARKAGVGVGAYADAERDKNGAMVGPVRGISAVRNHALPALLVLARRRSGLGLDATARAVGVSRVWVHKMEREGSAKLRGFWERRGFTFYR